MPNGVMIGGYVDEATKARLDDIAVEIGRTRVKTLAGLIALADDKTVAKLRAMVWEK